MHDTLKLFGVFSIPTFGTLIATGVLFFVILLIHLLRKNNVNERTIDNIILIGGISGIVFALGAHVFDTLWHSISYMKEHGTSFEMLWDQGGVTFSGGLFCGIICFFIIYPIFMKTERDKVFFYFDFIAIGICIAHAFGRLGCYFGGCCYGKVVPQGTFLSMIYPTELGYENIYPTQLFESVFLFILFAILLFGVKKNRTAWYLIGYNVFRFLLEYFRGDDRGSSPFGALSPSQLMSIILLVFGIVVLIFRKQIEEKLKTTNKIVQTESETTDTPEEENQLVVTEVVYKNNFLNKCKKHNFMTLYLSCFIFVLSLVFFGMIGNGVNNNVSTKQVTKLVNNGANFDYTIDDNLVHVYVDENNVLSFETTNGSSHYLYQPIYGKVYIKLTNSVVIEDTASYYYHYNIYQTKNITKPKKTEVTGCYNAYKMDEILGFYSNTKGPAEMEKAAINAFILSATKVLGSNSKGNLHILFFVILILELLFIISYIVFFFFGTKIFPVEEKAVNICEEPVNEEN